MKILFLHRNFPAQFRHLAATFAANPANQVVFVTARPEGGMQGVGKFLYKVTRTVSPHTHRYVRPLEEAVCDGQAAWRTARQLKLQKGFEPDVIYAHAGWGPGLFMRDLFPKARYLGFFEWYYHARGTDADFDPADPIDEDGEARIRIKNAAILLELAQCDAGIVPTQWQLQQFPTEFRSKLRVLHDGIDTQFFQPQPGAKLVLPPIPPVDLDRVLGIAPDALELTPTQKIQKEFWPPWLGSFCRYGSGHLRGAWDGTLSRLSAIYASGCFITTAASAVPCGGSWRRSSCLRQVVARRSHLSRQSTGGTRSRPFAIALYRAPILRTTPAGLSGLFRPRLPHPSLRAVLVDARSDGLRLPGDWLADACCRGGRLSMVKMGCWWISSIRRRLLQKSARFSIVKPIPSFSRFGNEREKRFSRDTTCQSFCPSMLSLSCQETCRARNRAPYRSIAPNEKSSSQAARSASRPNLGISKPAQVKSMTPSWMLSISRIVFTRAILFLTPLVERLSRSAAF